MKDFGKVKVVQRLVVGQGETVKLDIEDDSIVTVETVGGSRIVFPASRTFNSTGLPSITSGGDIAHFDVCVEEFEMTNRKLLGL
ncbi:hypothetical protein [Spongorhabdus nitratireducens]